MTLVFGVDSPKYIHSSANIAHEDLMFPVVENDLGKNGKWNISNKKRFLHFSERDTGMDKSSSSTGHCLVMPPRLWQSAGLRTKATKDSRVGASQRSKARPCACHLKSTLTLLPAAWGDKLPCEKPVGVRTLSYLQQKALFHKAFW